MIQLDFIKSYFLDENAANILTNHCSNSPQDFYRSSIFDQSCSETALCPSLIFSFAFLFFIFLFCSFFSFLIFSFYYSFSLFHFSLINVSGRSIQHVAWFSKIGLRHILGIVITEEHKLIYRTSR